MRRRALAAILLVAAGALYVPAANFIFATRMAAAIRRLASGDDGRALAVTQATIRRRFGDRELAALVYGPEDAVPDRAVLLVAGVSELGCRHPRLVALARTLADKGFAVLSPDIESFRRFEVSPEVIEEIAFWYRELPHASEAPRLRRSGIIGISFSGTLALMTAARPDIRDSVDFVVAVGPYDDLARLGRGWLAAGPATVPEGRYPTRCYGKWLLMISALDMIEDPNERRFFADALRRLLVEGKAPPAPADLSAAGSRWYRLAVMRETESDPELEHAIQEHLEPLCRRMSPEGARDRLRSPVFLAHGAFDDLIPPAESRALAARLRPDEVHLLVTPFLTHTHPLEQPLTLGEKARGVRDLVAFLYALGRAAR